MWSLGVRGYITRDVWQPWVIPLKIVPGGHSFDLAYIYCTGHVRPDVLATQTLRTIDSAQF